MIDSRRPRAPDQELARGRPALLLASRSARRRQLLSDAGFAHIAEHPGFEDAVLDRGAVSPRQWVAALATLKAWAGASLPSALEEGGRIVIGADTACRIDDALVGTPRSADEARAMLRSFVGRTHEVLTGVAVIDLRGWGHGLADLPASRRHVFVDAASVTWGAIGEDQIDAYVASGAWAGKAGGYNLSERLAAGWPIAYEGDKGTIMGLPMERLARLLRSMGGVAEGARG
jgi:septum formation protein